MDDSKNSGQGIDQPSLALLHVTPLHIPHAEMHLTPDFLQEHLLVSHSVLHVQDMSF